jgi:hypothetical protein
VKDVVKCCYSQLVSHPLDVCVLVIIPTHTYRGRP